MMVRHYSCNIITSYSYYYLLYILQLNPTAERPDSYYGSGIYGRQRRRGAETCEMTLKTDAMPMDGRA